MILFEGRGEERRGGRGGEFWLGGLTRPKQCEAAEHTADSLARS